ncbi:hypothetical protein M407DRAFT_217222 [Tulasnella calospora MUT 4182]|uniref:F-box domain-containing protein n=1 Tax=Tulasnella calospora MUT 4182 TaxID=1051891 RepID=A0A0C3QSJ4_9AGAM|nr:hypothetical protein M407DRAFT_217222 [Tulasnella calospora MUT 4182]
MAQYDENIRTSREIIFQLTSVIHQVEQLQIISRARARNARLPINTLPRELLSLIWTDVIYNAAITGIDAVWILAQVSKLWADVLFISSEMWCDISGAFSQKRVRWALEKSARRRLRIFFGAERNAADTFNILFPERHRRVELRLTAALPKGICSLSISIIQNGPTFSQLFALLSETPLLEERELKRLGSPGNGQSASSKGEQKPLVLSHLRKLLIYRVEGTLPSLLLSSIRADNCHSLVAAPFDLALSQNSSRGLRAFLAPMASFTEKLFLNISNDTGSKYAVLSTLDERDVFAPRAGMETTGFTIEFPVGRNCEKLQEAVSLIAYTPNPISISVHSIEYSDQTAIAELDWDQLPSLHELTIAHPFDPSPILFSLCKPRGPRQSPRWPCPQLTILRLPELLFPGFRWFLEQRWGPPANGGLMRDASRPTRLALCQVPKAQLVKPLSPEEMTQFADVWEDSAPPPQTELTAGDSHVSHLNSIAIKISWGFKKKLAPNCSPLISQYVFKLTTLETSLEAAAMSADSSNDLLNRSFLTLQRLTSESSATRTRATSPHAGAQYGEDIRTSENFIPQLTSVVRQVEQFQASHARARNARLPIHTLPRELLSLVWTEVIYNSALNGGDAVWILAQVSKLWADVLFISSEMWCDISSAFSQKRIGWALEKSAGRRLRIFLGGERNVTDTFDIVFPERHRWGELWLTAGLPKLISKLRAESLPLLELAKFRMRRHIGFAVEPPNLLGSPGLRSLLLDSTPPNWLSPSAVPKGIRSLSIRLIPNGPTFSQLVDLLSELPLLEELKLEHLDPPRGGHSAGSKGGQKPIVLPHLSKLLLFHVEETLLSLLLSSIRAENCYSLVAAPFDLALSQNSSRSLRAFLAPMASFTEKLFLNISNDFGRKYAVLSTLDEHDPFSPRAGMKTTGFTIGFPVGRNYEMLQEAVSFIAYTPTPISMSVHDIRYSDHAAIADLDWDQLPSLRELTINHPFDPSPILLNLCKPQGPRKSPRWPCPQLTVLRLPGLEHLPLGFCGFLEQRWGPPEDDGLLRDASRPARLLLCQAPKSQLADLLSPEEMAYFADVWEESAPVAQTELTTGE